MRTLYFCPMVSIFMAALCRLIGKAIIFLSCGFFLSIFLSFFPSFSSPNLSRRRLNVYHTSNPTRCGLSANLGCRSETCCTRLDVNTGRKKSPCRHYCANSSGHIFASKAHIDTRKKIVKQQYLLHMFSQYGELRPTNG